MPQYFEDLAPDARVGQVFSDLYGQAQALIEAMDGAREAEYGRGDGPAAVPGMDLAVSSSKVWPTENGGYYLARHVLTDSEASAPHKLFSAAAFYPGEGIDAEPTSVEGNRGDEIGGDYSLTSRPEGQPGHGFIIAGLKDSGAQRRLDEPPGTTKEGIQVPLSELGEEDKGRLAAVSRGIIDNFIIAEVIRDGASAEDALGMMGRIAAEL